MSAAVANDGIRWFVVLLVVLLAIMLVAVIRTPGWEGSSEEDTPPQPATAAPSRPVDAQARSGGEVRNRRNSGTAAPSRPLDPQARAAAAIARAAVVLPARRAPGPMPVPAVATSQPNYDGYAARHVAGPMPGEDTIPQPKVSGGPPWEQAPKPPGLIP
jgi:hypothetical protein